MLMPPVFPSPRRGKPASRAPSGDQDHTVNDEFDSVTGGSRVAAFQPAATGTIMVCTSTGFAPSTESAMYWPSCDHTGYAKPVVRLRFSVNCFGGCPSSPIIQTSHLPARLE